MELSDRDLDAAARVRIGDEYAFQAVFRQHHELLTSYCNGITHSSEVAGDILADVFASLWNGRKEWYPGSSITAYFITETRWRAKQIIAPADDDPSPDDRYSALVNEIIFLRWRAKLTSTEIALLLGVSEGKVNEALASALEPLSFTSTERLNRSLLNRYMAGELHEDDASRIESAVYSMPVLYKEVTALLNREMSPDIRPAVASPEVDFANIQIRISGLRIAERSRKAAITKARKLSSSAINFGTVTAITLLAALVGVLITLLHLSV